MEKNKKIVLALAFVCSILSVKAQKVKAIDSFRIIYQKYAPSLRMNITFYEGYSPNADTTIKIKNMAEFEALFKKEAQLRERRQARYDSLKQIALRRLN